MIAPNIHSLTGTEITPEFDLKQVTDSDTRFSPGALLSVTVEFLANSKWMSMAAILLVASISVLTSDHSIIQFLLTMIVTAIAVLSVSFRLKYRSEYSREIDRLYKLAYQDELTGLSNRRDILMQLEIAINNRTTGWVLMLDLDRFKQVNDRHGHEIGDKILKLAADRLSHTLPDNSRLARLGGDEFLVLADDFQELNKLVEDIKLSIATPFLVNGSCICIGVSVGAVRLPKTSCNVGDLLRRADTAMYQDKSMRKKKNNLQWQVPHEGPGLTDCTIR